MFKKKEVKEPTLDVKREEAMKFGDHDAVTTFNKIEFEHDKQLFKEWFRGFGAGYCSAAAGVVIGVIVVRSIKINKGE